MRVDTKHMGDVQFCMSTRGHEMYSDQPESNHGYDEAMTPPEIFLGALGACAAYYAVEYLKRNKLPYEGTRVETSAEKEKNPARLGEITFRVVTPSGLSAEHAKGVEAAVDRCILHNTLTHPPKMVTVVQGQVISDKG